MPVFLSIVIPAYNEQERVERTLDEVLAFIAGQSFKSEVIVVDDGSKDDTGKIVLSRAACYREAGYDLHLLTNTPNRGKGFSVKRGFDAARGKIVLFTDTDLSSPITEAPKLIGPIASNEADIVFGSRAIDRSLIGVRQSIMRDFGGRVFNFLMRIITGLDYKDTQCGFKAFRRAASIPVFRLNSIERFGFDPELLYIAKKLGLKLLEAPVIWNHCEGSKVSYFADSMNMFADLIRIRWNDLMGRYNVKCIDESVSEAEEEPRAERTAAGS